MNGADRVRLSRTVARWWTETRSQAGLLPTAAKLAAMLWEFLRASTPEQRRRRFGDIDYDWQHRVNTTGATVSPRDRLLGMFLSPYQPTEPALFQTMLANLNIDFREFTFVDLGSGKGRTLLMASEFPFRRIIGVELLPDLHIAAEQNVRQYNSGTQKCTRIEAICRDAREFEFPIEPTVLYLFNPLPKAGLVRVMERLQQSLREHPRPLLVVYHNPLLEKVLSNAAGLKKIGGTHQFVLYASQALRDVPASQE